MDLSLIGAVCVHKAKPVRRDIFTKSTPASGAPAMIKTQIILVSVSFSAFPVHHPD